MRSHPRSTTVLGATALLATLGLLALVSSPARAAEITVALKTASTAAESAETPLGQVRIVETAYGLAFYPALSGLAPGLHGFHVHEKPSCAPAEQNGQLVPALAAGGHYDPSGSKKHGEPWRDDNHLGDLPPLYVDSEGRAQQPVLAPRLKRLAEIQGRALMIHAGGDNHADHPAPLGGGGARVGCGVIAGG